MSFLLLLNVFFFKQVRFKYVQITSKCRNLRDRTIIYIRWRFGKLIKTYLGDRCRTSACWTLNGQKGGRGSLFIIRQHSKLSLAALALCVCVCVARSKFSSQSLGYCRQIHTILPSRNLLLINISIILSIQIFNRVPTIKNQICND